MEVSDETSRENNELAPGCLPDQRRVPTSKAARGETGKDSANGTANGDMLEPDPTCSGPSQAPGFPSAT